MVIPDDPNNLLRGDVQVESGADVQDGPRFSLEIRSCTTRRRPVTVGTNGHLRDEGRLFEAMTAIERRWRERS